MQNNVLLEVKDLVTEFKSDGEIHRAVDGVSFTLHKGETIGIVGESGSGKSVTSLSIMQLIPNPPGRVSGGDILYHSRNNGVVNLRNTPSEEMRSYRGKIGRAHV